MKNPRPVTLTEIAAAADCSVAVVSRALSTDALQQRTVARRTAQRIVAAAHRLGYTPRRSRVRRRALGVIGVFVPENHTTLMLELLVAITSVANTTNTPIHCYNNANATSFRHFTDTYANSNRSTGIIAYYPPDPADVGEFVRMCDTLRRNDAQIVLIHNNAPPDFAAVSVKIDNYHGGALAGEYLGQMQLREYFLLSCYNYAQPYRQERVRGFMDAVARCHGQVTHFQVGNHNLNLSPADLELPRLLKIVDWQTPGAVGIFVENDGAALVVNNYLLANGIKVGKQVKLVGYDDQMAAALAWPGLTTVRQPFREMGETAMRKLFSLMTGGQEKSELLKPELIIRGSA